VAFEVINTGSSGNALWGTGGTAYDSPNGEGGVGVTGYGGNSYGDANPDINTSGGPGVYGVGGSAFSYDLGGPGGFFVGGPGPNTPGVIGGGGVGIIALPGSQGSVAAEFSGDVEIYGNLSKSGGSFKIDHPLDPANKYLYHSFVESPDMMDIYNGNVITDGSGAAIVTLPDWFESLNSDFRYQLTVIGQFAQAIVASKMANNKFEIRTNKGGVEVSWQVTGIRHDPWANAHRLPVEQDKSEKERGHYIHPELFGHTGEPSIVEIGHPRPTAPDRQ
jgi:hypothetical protein